MPGIIKMDKYSSLFLTGHWPMIKEFNEIDTRCHVIKLFSFVADDNGK